VSEKENKSLKPGWRRVKFGEVVRQCKEKTDPGSSGLARYIAGDHMDTDDLRLRRWGEIGSGYLGPAFHIRFKPGQVLYGSRRTYLRKVAVADFEGVCANTTFVLEPKNPGELLPEFLPFLMQTEAFNAFSVKNSKGSVNPYINFSDLERFEFALPPTTEQKRIVALLQAFDGVSQCMIDASDASKALKSSLTEDAFPISEAKAYLADPESYQGRLLVRLGDLAMLQVGFPFKSAGYSESGDRLLRGSNVGVNRLLWGSDITCYWPTERRNDVLDYILRAGDLVIAMDRPFISEGFKIARITESDLPALLLQRVGRFNLSDRITPEYLWAFLHSESFKWQLQRMQKGTDLPHISRFDIEGTLIPVLSLEDQAAVADLFSSAADAGATQLKRADVNRKQRNAALMALVGSGASNV
jgi:type I restriction enzyme S subunit